MGYQASICKTQMHVQLQNPRMAEEAETDTGLRPCHTGSSGVTVCAGRRQA